MKKADRSDGKMKASMTGGQNQTASVLNVSRASSSRGLPVSREISKLGSAANTSTDQSQFLQSMEDKTNSQTIDMNNTYKSVLAVDPAERLKPKKKASEASSKLHYDDYVKSKVKAFRPEEVYYHKDQAFVHMTTQIESRDARGKNVANFMTSLHREMEDRKMRERREDLKRKINMKVPKKVQHEDFLVKQVI